MSLPPIGITPTSSFELEGFAPQLEAPAILADKIDPVTGDFASLTEGLGVADGMVIQGMRVQRGSGAAVRAYGQRFREVRFNDGKATETMKSYAREALKPAVDSGTLRFVSLKSEIDDEDPTQIQTTIEYQDLLAPQKDPNRRLTFNP